MEILGTFWTTLVTPNAWVSNFLINFLVPIDAIVNMLLFTTILNIRPTKKEKIIYVICVSILIFICKTFIPYPYSGFANIAIMFLSALLILKANAIKSFFALLIPLILTTLLETVFSKLYVTITGIPYYEVGFSIPIYRLSIILLVYLIIYLLYKLVKKYNFNITLIDNIDKGSKKKLIVIFVLGTISIVTQLYLTVFYSSDLPVPITILSMIGLLSYFFITLYNLTKTNELGIANQDIENLQLYNKTLIILHDNIRAFKHDFNNIVSRNRPDLSLLTICKD